MEWFRKTLPIRQKLFLSFAVLIGVQSAALAIGALALWSAPAAPDALVGLRHGFALLAALCFGFSLIMAVLFRSAIADPYVRTVVRMEALAAGDLESPIAFIDYLDCVGRMTRAMHTFREAAMARIAAEKALRSSKEQQDVVAALSDGLQKMAAGNFEHKISKIFAGEYEALRQNFNSASTSLQAALGAVNDAAQRIRTGSAEISHASDDLATRTERQASSVEETALAMERLALVVRNSAESASEAERFTLTARENAQLGSDVVRNAVQAMAAIEKSSAEIAQIISVIDGISFQTNLLALNAGVEAARAGDSGKGFAVVANEVRALAQRSAESANEIKQLISKSAHQVQSGVKLVNQTGEAFGNIFEGINTTASLVRDIASSTKEQAQGIGKVNSAVSDIEKSTQQNAAMVEQATAAARSLSAEAIQLGEMVNRFEFGGHSAPVRGHSLQQDHVAQSRPRPAPRPAPRVVGNLALAADPEDDWTEF